MIRAALPTLVLMLGLAGCEPKNDATNVPQGGNKGELTPTVDANPNPVGPECVAKCLEGDQFKDQAVEDREKSCEATCPPAAGESTPEAGEAGEGEGADAGAPAAEG